MAITSVDGLVAALTASTRQRVPIAKTATVTSVAGGQSSYWRSTGAPTGQGATPSTTASTCNNTTVGGILYTNATSPAVTYIARLGLMSSTIQSTEIHDRLAHMGGLSGTVTTAQTVNIDLNSMAGTDNITARVGPTNYSAVQWFIECYSVLGSTAVTATISYVNQSGTAGSCTVAIPATFQAGRLLQIVPTTSGDNIRAISTVTLSATTGTAGSFGVTATVEKTSIVTPLINNLVVVDWAMLGLPTVVNSSCLFFVGDATGTTVGTLGGSVTLVQG